MKAQEALRLAMGRHLLEEADSFTLAAGEEAETISIALAHPLLLYNVKREDMAHFLERLRRAYEEDTMLLAVSPDGVVTADTLAAWTDESWEEDGLLFFEARKALSRPAAPFSLEPLLHTMDALLSDHGCPWDKKQTHESLRTYFLQETYEVIDAIDRKDWENLREELGDVLYQIVFHARLAEREGYFTMQDVVDGISKKMVDRHPFVFGDGTNTALPDFSNWEKRKRIEKNRKYLLSGVPKALPSQLLACIIQKKVGSSGWGALLGKEEFTHRIRDFLADVQSLETFQSEEMQMGALLFAIDRVISGEGMEPELALRRFCMHFMDALQSLEEEWKREGKDPSKSTPEEVLASWQRCCRKEASVPGTEEDSGKEP